MEERYGALLEHVSCSLCRTYSSNINFTVICANDTDRFLFSMLGRYIPWKWVFQGCQPVSVNWTYVKVVGSGVRGWRGIPGLAVEVRAVGAGFPE